MSDSRRHSERDRSRVACVFHAAVNRSAMALWKDKLEFVKVGGANPEQLPIGPTTVIGDDIGFVRP